MERYDLTHSMLQQDGELPTGACRDRVAMAIGFFDGVHRGHAEVIRQAVAAARELGYAPAVLTFSPHPRSVLGKDGFHTVLTPLEDKLTLFAELGVELAYVVAFDSGFAEVTADRFVRRLLLPLGVRTAVVGFDFRFGHRGQGDADALRSLSEDAISVRVVEPVFEGDVKISSTRIRERLAEGDTEAAAMLLGRPYAISGEIVHGDARGRQLGFPTANMMPSVPYVIPRHGVYAVTVTGAAGQSCPLGGVINVGVRPTFDAPGGASRLETNLFDFEGDLYGQTLTVRFHRFLRPETKFDSFDALKSQIAKDADQARSELSALGLF
ncbi:bifunctional riboflavin kinase/FAD synthetase [Cohnella sp. JJ-181]|uniref:bifunctional riboflavin kinase/FAD synthetase n=1 Tax=Cohnella rhizoplanae TaxID=2974897 RepID=UPI0022FF62A5|nr:bifunctional riboflavin kinase/FAD synthetase [Cohnella sp. JJ-181]CAI6028127.1 Bifunctional riboflavin kinase/FMN adenylyltransferase [Cohnella sp. JJ-181]